MPELSIDIYLPAPPERVWNMLTDFDAYAEWNPYQTIEGRAEAFGSIKIMWRASSGKKVPAARAVIWVFEPHARLEFFSGKPFWFASKRFFHLTPCEGGTQLRHGVKFSGLWANWRFSRDHKIERLRPHYDALGKALADRLAGRPSRKSGVGNRHSRRAQRANQGKETKR